MSVAPNYSALSADARYRDFNANIAPSIPTSEMQSYDNFKMVPTSGAAVDEMAANRHQERFFHLKDATMMSMQIMGLTMDNKAMWLLNEPDGFPIRTVDSLKWIRRRLIFDQSGWEVNAEEGPNRTMQSYSRTESGMLIRRGKQIEISGESMSLPEGMAFIEMQKKQVVISFTIELAYNTLCAMLMSRENTLDDLTEAGFFDRDLQYIIDVYYNEFNAFQKSKDIRPYIGKLKEALENRASRPSAKFICLPLGLHHFLKDNTTNLLVDQNNNLQVADSKSSSTALITVFEQMRVRHSFKVLNPDAGPIKIDPLVSPKTVSLFYRMLPLPLAYYQAPGNDYKSNHRNISVMNMSLDERFVISIETAIKHCISFQTFNAVYDEDEALDDQPYDSINLRKTRRVVDIPERRLDNGFLDKAKKFKLAKLMGALPLEWLSVKTLVEVARSLKKKNLLATLKNMSKFTYAAAGGGGYTLDDLKGYVRTNFRDNVVAATATNEALNAHTSTKSRLMSDVAPLGADRPGLVQIASALHEQGDVVYGAIVSKTTADASSTPTLSTQEMHEANLTNLSAEQSDVYTRTLQREGVNYGALVANVHNVLRQDNPLVLDAQIMGPMNTVLTTTSKRDLKSALEKLNQAPESQATTSTADETVKVLETGYYGLTDVESLGDSFIPLSSNGTPIATGKLLNIYEAPEEFMNHYAEVRSVPTAHVETQIQANLRGFVQSNNGEADIAATYAANPVVANDMFDNNRTGRYASFAERLRLALLQGPPADFASEVEFMEYLLAVSGLEMNLITLKRLNQMEVHIPFGFLVIFPSVRIHAATVIIGSGGSDTGFNAINNPNVWKGIDPNHKKAVMNFTANHGVVVSAPQNFIIGDNVATVKYCRGHSDEGFVEETLAEFKNNKYDMGEDEGPSFYTMLVPLTHKVGMTIDLRGYFGEDPPQDKQKYHFITDYTAVSRLWSNLISLTNPYDMPEYDGSLIKYPVPNTASAQGMQLCFDTNTNRLTAMIASAKSPFGRNMVPGMMSTIASLETTFPLPPEQYSVFELDHGW